MSQADEGEMLEPGQGHEVGPLWVGHPLQEGGVWVVLQSQVPPRLAMASERTRECWAHGGSTGQAQGAGRARQHNRAGGRPMLSQSGGGKLYQVKARILPKWMYRDQRVPQMP